MDGFKTLPKMQCFKEGGKVKPKAMCYGGKMKKGGEVGKADMEQDKKLIKKAFKQHDEAEHDKEPTEIKLRKGGRAKKETGTVKKYKTGGEVTNVYEAKKGSGDLDNIEKVKKIKPTAAKAPSKASTKPAMKGSDVAKEKSKPAGTSKAKKVSESPKKADAASGAKEMPNKYKTGGKVKKMADGGRLTDADIALGSAVKGVGPRGNLNDLVYRPTDPAEQQRMAQKFAIENGPAVDKNASFTRPMGARPMVARKKGGDVKKFADGGYPGMPSNTAVDPTEQAHQLALMKEMQKLPPYMQLQLLNQQQAAGRFGAGLSGIANQMQPQGTMPMMPSGVNPYQD